MTSDTWGALILAVALVVCYSWSVWNLHRGSRRPPAGDSDGGDGGTRIVLRSGHQTPCAPEARPALRAADPAVPAVDAERR
jgi:hypothetical protein